MISADPTGVERVRPTTISKIIPRMAALNLGFRCTGPGVSLSSVSLSFRERHIILTTFHICIRLDIL